MDTIYFALDRHLGTPQQPHKQHNNDAGFDLFTSRTVTIPGHEFVDVHTDVRMSLPRGFFARITGRSSTMRTHGLLVAEGIIDGGYRGELFVGVRNLSGSPMIVTAGMRLAQLIPHRIHPMRWMKTETLPVGDRGDHGFGSTGT